jgi:hypothetical protein
MMQLLKPLMLDKTLNDTKKLAQSRELKALASLRLVDRLLGVAILLIVAALFSLVRVG